jgi:hypothetical protein
MADLNMKQHLKDILRAIEGEQYRDALAIFTTIFQHPSAKIPEVLINDLTHLLVFVFSKTSILDRAVFAKSISRSQNLPAVSSHLVLLAPFTDDELIDMIDKGDLARKLTITQRPNLPMPVTDQLVTGGELQVLVGLAKNLTAKLSRRSFDVMASVASADPDMDKALAVRDDLPVDIASKLSRKMRAGTEARMAKLIKDDLAPKRAPLVLRGPGV